MTDTNTTTTPTPLQSQAQSVFSEDQTFADLGLRDSVLRGVEAAGFEKPTEIQAQLIPRMLAGKDLMGQARTGTGKTAAFGLPIFHMADPDLSMQALVLTPTRELAAQVAADLQNLGQSTPIKTVCIVGGESMRHQQKSLKEGGHIMVGTPGRVMDLYSRNEISFDNLRFACLDEVDRMLDIGFREDIRKILGKIKGDHQTVFCSATISEEIEKLSRRFMNDDAEKVNVVSGSLTVGQVDQKYFSVEPWDKRALLLKVLHKEKPEAALVFCRTKATVRKLTQYLRDKNMAVREIHGDLHQTKRTKVMKSLRNRSADIVIASDLAARGLDVEHISHVINYDLPDDPEIYIHRVGRTARAGRGGKAWSFVTPEQGQLLTEIEKLTSVLIDEKQYEDFTPGKVPEDIRKEREQVQKQRQSAEQGKGRQEGIATEDLSEEQLKQMFPNGVIPQSAPRRSLGTKFRRRGR